MSQFLKISSLFLLYVCIYACIHIKMRKAPISQLSREILSYHIFLPCESPLFLIEPFTSGHQMCGSFFPQTKQFSVTPPGCPTMTNLYYLPRGSVKSYRLRAQSHKTAHTIHTHTHTHTHFNISMKVRWLRASLPQLPLTLILPISSAHIVQSGTKSCFLIPPLSTASPCPLLTTCC